MEKLTVTRSPIHDLIGRRWSSLAFSDRPVESAKILSILEAARWAASSRNEQPWAFILATREERTNFESILNVLMPGNREWAQNAAVLILGLAHTQWTKEGTPNRLGFHDLGQATSNLVMQATALSLSTHQMGGFDVEAARQRFHVPAGWEPVTVIALGHPGDANALPEPFREREMSPRKRKPLEQFVFSGAWGNPAAIVDPATNK